MKNQFLEEFELRSALRNYQKAIKLDPNNAGPFNGIGDVYSGLGDFDRAIEYYQKAINLDPNNAGPFNGIGSAYSALGDFDKAIEYYQKAIKLDPNEPSAWFYLGSAYLSLERYGDALAVFKDALKVHNGNSFILNGLCLARYKLKKSNKTVNKLKTASIKKTFKI